MHPLSDYNHLLRVLITVDVGTTYIDKYLKYDMIEKDKRIKPTSRTIAALPAKCVWIRPLIQLYFYEEETIAILATTFLLGNERLFERD